MVETKFQNEDSRLNSPQNSSNLDRKRLLGAFQAIAAGCGFGFLGIFAKLAYLRGISIGELLTFRFWMATFILFSLLALLQRKLLRIDPRQFVVCMILGALGYAVFASFYFAAIKGVSTALAALLLYTFPTMVTIGAFFLYKEKIGVRGWLALAVASLGLGVLLWGEPVIHSWLSVWAGLAAAFFYSIYILASHRLQSQIHPLTSAVYVMLSAGIVLYIFHRPDVARLSSFQVEDWGLIVALAIICTIGPMVLFLSGLQKLSNNEASILCTAEPLTAAIAAYLVLGEILTAPQLIGGALIITSLVLTVFRKKAST